ncbi:MAG: hypothetical protein HY863_07200 [Chloroflexi bacterium]|nr:hypothetical protein [Chloroflexota bacterium]
MMEPLLAAFFDHRSGPPAFESSAPGPWLEWDAFFYHLSLEFKAAYQKWNLLVKVFCEENYQ